MQKYKEALTSAPLPVYDEVPTYEILVCFDQSTPKKSQGMVCALKVFLKSCLDLIKDEDELREFRSILDESER